MLRRGLPLWERTYSGLLNLVFPSKCPVCGGASDTYVTSPICFTCWSEGLKPYDGPSCSVCAEPFQSGYGTICQECRDAPPQYTRAMSYGLYAGALREAIHLLKFSHIKRLSRPIGGLLMQMKIPDVDVIIPVPVSARSLRERGFNHSALIAGELSKGLGVALSVGLLYKKKDTPPQVGLSRAGRLKNLKGAFAARGRLNGERVLLIDDVMTTGATARECSKTLIKAGVKEVLVATPARSA